MNAKTVSFFSFFFVSALLAQFVLMGSAASVTSLPPRPTATPTAVPTKVPSHPTGGEIELQVVGATDADLWTVVQWQDAQGDWHDVNGWQGGFDAGHVKTWWVGAEYLGAGPFRWVVQQDGAAVGVSAPFDLPAAAGAKVVVPLSLD